MSEKKKADPFKDLMGYLESKEFKGVVEIKGILENPIDFKTLTKRIDPFVLRFFKAVLTAIDQEMEFHESGNEEVHMKHLQNRIYKLEGRLKNHRHETSKTFGTKPTF